MHEIDLNGALTVEDVIGRLTIPGEMKLEPGDDWNLILIDETAGDEELLSVTGLNGSLAAVPGLGLGLFGEDEDDDGRLVGTALAGLSFGDRFFIMDDAELGGRITLEATDIDASARLGFLGIDIIDGHGSASIGATISVNPQDDGRVTLRELFCLLYTSPSPRDLSTSRMPSSA